MRFIVQTAEYDILLQGKNNACQMRYLSRVSPMRDVAFSTLGIQNRYGSPMQRYIALRYDS